MLLLYMSLIDDEGDKELFEEIYYSYRKQMMSVAVSFLENQDDAEDAVHDVFYRIASKHIGIIREIETEDDRRNYLLKATKNTAINMLRRKNRKDLSLDTVIENGQDNSKDYSDDSFLDTVCNKIEYEKLVEAIKHLNDSYRIALYYHFVVRMTAQDIADYLNCSLSTVKKQLVRGKKQLLQELEIAETEINCQ